MSRVLFHKLAKEEFFQARDFYDELIFGLGKTFVLEIERCLNIIKRNPLAYPQIRENIRKAVIIKFPYSILYRIEKQNVYILAVMHQKRKPQYWSNRI
jgi:ParE toxin of type II toxin-antitoxin system, parDE